MNLIPPSLSTTLSLLIPNLHAAQSKSSPLVAPQIPLPALVPLMIPLTYHRNKKHSHPL